MVGGNPGGLAAAERELGLESTTIALQEPPFGYPADSVVWDELDRPLVCELKRWRLLWHAVRDFDVVHFNFGSTIAPQRIPRDAPGVEAAGRLRDRSFRAYSALLEQVDLPVLRRAGKAIFVTFQGDDARQGDVSGQLAVNGAVEVGPGHYTPESDRDKRRRIARFDRHADGIYALNPDLLRVLPARQASSRMPISICVPGNRHLPLVASGRSYSMPRRIEASRGRGSSSTQSCGCRPRGSHSTSSSWKDSRTPRQRRCTRGPTSSWTSSS